MRVYEIEEDIVSLVDAFETATITSEDWKHREHLIVALHYVSHFDLDTAIEKMRSGILNLLKNGFKVDMSREMPYHETLTIFWMRTVKEFNATCEGASLIAKADKMVERFDRDYPLKFYSRDLLFSDLARSTFVECDIGRDSNLKLG